LCYWLQRQTDKEVNFSSRGEKRFSPIPPYLYNKKRRNTMTERNYKGSYKFEGMVTGDVYKNFQRKLEYELKKEAAEKRKLNITQEDWLKHQKKGSISIALTTIGSIVVLAIVLYLMFNF
jgi:hypothetical protein